MTKLAKKHMGNVLHEGFNAHLCKLKREHNPYSEGTEKRHLWFKGWDLACQYEHDGKHEDTWLAYVGVGLVLAALLVLTVGLATKHLWW